LLQKLFCDGVRLQLLNGEVLVRHKGNKIVCIAVLLQNVADTARRLIVGGSGFVDEDRVMDVELGRFRPWGVGFSYTKTRRL
jgi:hypothetical protein